MAKTALLEQMTENNLKNAIWMCKNGMVPTGGYPLEWYEEELFKRTGSKRGYHEDD